MATNKYLLSGELEKQQAQLVTEKGLIGSILKDPTQLVQSRIYVTEDCFLDSTHRDIWKAMVALETRNEKIDLITVSDTLTRMGKTNMHVVLIELTEAGTTARNLEHYSKLVLNNWGDRRARKIMSLSFLSDVINIDTVISSLTRLNADLSATAINGTPWRVPSEKIFESVEKGEEVIEGIMNQDTFPKLNKMSQVARGDLVIIGGMTSMGKTAFALRYCTGLVKSGYQGIYFLYEGSDNSLQRRVIGQESGVPISKIRSGHLSAEEKKRVLELKGTFEEQLVYHDQATTATDIINKVKMQIDTHVKPDFICIDHIHLMPLEKENMRMGIIDLTKKLIKFGKDEGILIIGLAQFRKEDAGRDKERPTGNSLRESSTIKQDAHHIWLLHDPDFLEKKEKAVQNLKYSLKIGVIESPPPAEIIVEKNREGTTGIIPAKFNRDIGLWKEIFT